MVRDYGFDLPDKRHGFYDVDGELVTVHIVRHWRQAEDDRDESTFDVSFDIHRGSQVTHLPVGTDQSKAVDIAHRLYEEDPEATEDYDDTEAIYAAERRMGA